VSEKWRKLHNEELHDIYFSQNIIWVISGQCMRHSGGGGGERGKKKEVFFLNKGGEGPRGGGGWGGGGKEEGKQITRYYFKI